MSVFVVTFSLHLIYLLHYYLLLLLFSPRLYQHNTTTMNNRSVARTSSRNTPRRSTSSSSEPSLLPKRTTFRKRRGNGSNGWLYVAMAAGVLFIGLDVWYLGKYVFLSSQNNNSAPPPAVWEARRDEDEPDEPIEAQQPAAMAEQPAALVGRMARADAEIRHEDEVEANPAGIRETDHQEEDVNPEEGDSHDDVDGIDQEEEDIQNIPGYDPDKEPLLQILRDAQITMTPDIIASLPKWTDVTALYGENPVVYGLDQCEVFQHQVTDPAEHFLAAAGTFNTGTNLLAELLIHNCHLPARMKKYGVKNRGVRWQVLWGKHTPVNDEEFRKTHKTYQEDSLSAENIFPAVTVRDPYKWMQSVSSVVVVLLFRK